MPGELFREEGRHIKPPRLSHTSSKCCAMVCRFSSVVPYRGTASAYFSMLCRNTARPPAGSDIFCWSWSSFFSGCCAGATRPREPGNRAKGSQRALGNTLKYTLDKTAIRRLNYSLTRTRRSGNLQPGTWRPTYASLRPKFRLRAFEPPVHSDEDQQ